MAYRHGMIGEVACTGVNGRMRAFLFIIDCIKCDFTTRALVLLWSSFALRCVWLWLWRLYFGGRMQNECHWAYYQRHFIRFDVFAIVNIVVFTKIRGSAGGRYDCWEFSWRKKERSIHFTLNGVCFPLSINSGWRKSLFRHWLKSSWYMPSIFFEALQFDA